MRTKTTKPILAGMLSTAVVLLRTSDAAAAVARRKRGRMTIAGGKVPYYRNRPLSVCDARVTRAIIVIHGRGRSAAEYCDTILDNLPSNSDPARDWSDKTIVLAPHFQAKRDAAGGEYWWGSDWREGGDSGGLSSYAVIDAMVARLRSGAFPNLKWIVITGHSAGGQFTQRYAAFTDIDLNSGPNSGLVKFVPSNPLSYVYLNPYRFSDANAWVVPSPEQSAGYNTYKYGLDGLYSYAGNRGADWARSCLPRRWVELLAGAADVVSDSGFDDSYQAMWQGPTRYQRAQRFDAFMDEFYPTNRFRMTPVPGVGHHHRRIYESPQAANALYFAD